MVKIRGCSNVFGTWLELKKKIKRLASFRLCNEMKEGRWFEETNIGTSLGDVWQEHGEGGR